MRICELNIIWFLSKQRTEIPVSTIDLSVPGRFSILV